LAPSPGLRFENSSFPRPSRYYGIGVDLGPRHPLASDNFVANSRHFYSN
jgi:hypothetical protein